MRTTTMNTTEWARAHGEHYRGTVAMDNHEPTRSYVTFDCYSYDREGERCWIIVRGVGGLVNGHKANWLMDDGTTVTACYAAGWKVADDDKCLIVHPFPVNVNADGSPRLRADDGRPVDHSTWSVGPRRTYHVKLTAVGR